MTRVPKPVAPETFDRTPPLETAAVRAPDEARPLASGLAPHARVFETILFSIVDFVYIFDWRERLLYANPSRLDLWGLPLEAAIGKKFRNLALAR